MIYKVILGYNKQLNAYALDTFAKMLGRRIINSHKIND